MIVRTHTRIVSALVALAASISLAQASSVSLQSSRTTSKFGSSVTLTATVTPSTATGKITFFDGSSILGYRQISGGTASFGAELLSSGTHSLSAFYSGDSANASATSLAISQTVYPTAATSIWNNISVAVPINPAASVTADFNGDGFADVAAVQAAANGTVTILLGHGNGTLTLNCGGSGQPLCPAVGGNPNAIVAGDFNEDGNTDLAVANGDGSLSLLSGNGDGTFSPAVTVLSGNPSGSFLSITAADFNSDGILDLAVSDSSHAYILLGDGTGKFSQSTVYTGEVAFVSAIQAADLNNDGMPDLAFVVMGSGGNSVQILFGAGNGTFPSTASVAVSQSATSLAVGDFDGDGSLDIAVSNNTPTGTISVLINDGMGNFALSGNYTAGPFPSNPLAVDLNGDGKLDLVVGNAGNAIFNVLLGNGDGTFAALTSYSLSHVATAWLTVGDFNRDGRADLAVSENGGTSVDVFLGAGPSSSIAANAPQLQSTQVNTSFSSILEAVITDSSGNRVPYISVTFTAPTSGASAILSGPESSSGAGTTLTVTTDGNGNATVSALANTIAGSYVVSASVAGVGITANFALTNAAGAAANITATRGTPQSAALNTPFAKALVTTITDQFQNPVPGATVVFTSPATGASANLSSYNISTDSNGVASANASANGNLGAYQVTATIQSTETSANFYLSNKNAAAIALTSSKSSVTFGSRVTLTATVTPGSVTGKVTFFDGANILAYAPLTPGPTSAVASISTILLSNGPHSITAFYSGDANYTSVTSSVLSAPAVSSMIARTLVPGVSIPTGNAVASVVGDFNGDGIADLALTDASAGGVSVLLGNGDGTFQDAVSYSLGSPLAGSGATAKNPVAIAATDVNGDGALDIAVANVGDGTVSILLGKGDGTFDAVQSALPGQTVSLGRLSSLGVGDFNGDGVPDLVVTNSAQSYAQVMLGNGDGTFTLESATFATGSGPANVQVRDVNGDGIADLITANSGSNNISVLLGNGDGTFAAAVSYAVEANPKQAVVADFNHDGKPDIAVVAYGSGDVDVLLGQGTGGFNGYTRYTVESSPDSLAILDFNGDGNVDLAVVNNSDSTISVLPGNGDGTFGTQTTYNVTNGPQYLVVGDFNGDGRTDLAVNINGASQPPAQVDILLGISSMPAISVANGAQQSATVSSPFPAPLAATVSDGSGNPIAGVPVTFSAPSAGTSPGVSLSSTTGITNSHGIASVLATANTVAGAYYASATAAGVNGSAQFLLTNIAGPAMRLSASQTSTPQSAPVNSQFPSPLVATVLDAYGNPVPGVGVNFTIPLSGATATLSANAGVTDKNGNASITSTANGTTGSYTVVVYIPETELSTGFALTNTQAGPSIQLQSGKNPSSFGAKPAFTVTVSPAAATGKVTLYDGVNPVASQTLAAGAATLATNQLSSGKHLLTAYYSGDSNYFAGRSSVLLQSVSPVPATTFFSAPNATVGNGPASVTHGDFNGDGIDDLAIVNKSDATITIMLGKGDGTFTNSATLTAGVAPVAILSADFNADGVPDLAVADSYSNNVEVLLGKEDGTFAPAIASSTLSGLISLAVGDFNGDGVTDLLAAVTYQGGAVQVLLGAGDGTFAQSRSILIPGPLSIAVTDFNNDGLADFAVANNSDNVYVFVNSGGAEFGAGIPLPVQSGQTFVTTGDLNLDGNADLVLADTGSANLMILLGNGDGTFQIPATVSVGDSSPDYIQIADLNGDGNPDLAVGYLDGRSIGVLAGNGDGTFGTITTTYLAGLLPSSLVAGDFDGDGRADLAVANQGSDTVSVLLGSGPATLIIATAGNQQSEPISTVFPTSLQALVTDSSGNPVPGVTVTFAAPPTGAIAVLSAATALTNSAGLASVKATSNTVAGSYSVTASAPGVPNVATFALTNAVGPVATLVSIAGTPQTAAFNAPFASALQVLVTDAGGNPVPGVSVNFSAPASGASALLSSAQATTNSSGVAAVTATASAVAGSYNVSSSVGGISTPALFALANSSLRPSLTLVATPNPVNFGGTLSISALLNVTNPTGTVTFYDGTNIVGSQRVSSGAATISTLLLSSGKHSIYASYSGDSNYPQGKSTALNESINLVAASTLVGGATQTVGTSPVSVAIGDFNQDGKDDIAVVNSGSGTVTVSLGNGDGTFVRPATYSVGLNPSAIAITDLNSDGVPDLIVANSASNSLSILLGNGDGTFAAPTTVTGNFTAPISLAVADFNHDGKADVAVGNGSNSGVSILFGNGAGGFTPSTPLNVPAGSKSLVVGDFNGDGNADIAIANNLAGSILVVLGNGDGTFANPLSYGAGLAPVSLTAADFNGDGNTDLAVVNSSDNAVSILLGNGDGTFATASNVTVGSAPTSIAALDLEGRGIIDLLVTNSGDNTVSYLAGNGYGTFAAPATYTSGTQPVSIAPADFNSDGKPDLAIANEVGGTVSTLLGSEPAGTVAITTTSLADGNIGTAYSSSVSAQGGTTPYSWSIASGVLPSGLTLDTARGAITGTPNGPAGTSSFTVQLSDSSSPVQTTSKHFSITIAAAGVSLSISTSSLANGVVGAAYSQTFTAQGGITPYSWSVATGALPAGLTLNTTSGAITGTPGSPAGTSSFTVQVTDSSSPVQTATKQLSITITQASSTNVNPLFSLILPTGTQQPGSSVTTGEVQAGQTVASAVTGTVTVNFNPNASGLPNPWSNPGVCFAASSCSSPPQTSATFTLPAGSTTVSIPAIQIGTVAGDVVLTLSVSGQPDTTSTLTIPRTAPVIEANSAQILDLNSSGFAVEVVANSSPRDLQSASFTFNAANGAQISGSATFTVDLSSTMSQWYAGSEGQTYGSAFSLQVPFTLSGNPSAIQSVTVTLTNSAGTSVAVTGTP